MIVRLCEDTPKLHIRVSQLGCGRRALLDASELIIQPPDGGAAPDTPTLRYPAFEMDDDGRVVFYFDKKLWTLPNGRYNATVVVPGGKALTFGIDLCNRTHEIDQMAVTTVAPCGEISC